MPASCVGAFLMAEDQGRDRPGNRLRSQGRPGRGALCGLHRDRIDTLRDRRRQTCSFQLLHGRGPVPGSDGSQSGQATATAPCPPPAARRTSSSPWALPHGGAGRPWPGNLTSATSRFSSPPTPPGLQRILMPIRKSSERAPFNLMGPLLNPARPTHSSWACPRPGCAAHRRGPALTGVRNAAVVHGAGGYDELSPFGPAEVVWIRDGWTRRETLDPQTLASRATSSPKWPWPARTRPWRAHELLEATGPSHEGHAGAQPGCLPAPLGAGLTLKQGVEKLAKLWPPAWRKILERTDQCLTSSARPRPWRSTAHPTGRRRHDARPFRRRTPGLHPLPLGMRPRPVMPNTSGPRHRAARSTWP